MWVIWEIMKNQGLYDEYWLLWKHIRVIELQGAVSQLKGSAFTSHL